MCEVKVLQCPDFTPASRTDTGESVVCSLASPSLARVCERGGALGIPSWTARSEWGCHIQFCHSLYRDRGFLHLNLITTLTASPASVGSDMPFCSLFILWPNILQCVSLPRSSQCPPIHIFCVGLEKIWIAYRCFAICTTGILQYIQVFCKFYTLIL